jgi:metal-sulfur cluster biosynthetic enzyme
MPLIESLPSEFSKRFAAWLRIEPRCRSDDFSPGLAARVADPLWLLARQWQLGEFTAEDAGYPIRVEIASDAREIATVTLGPSSTPIPLAGGPPLEAIVERERVNLDEWRVRVQIGQQFERLARARFNDRAQAIIGTYRRIFGIGRPADQEVIKFDRATWLFLGLVAGHVVDGDALMQVMLDCGLLSDDAHLEAKLQEAINGNKLPSLPEDISLSEAAEVIGSLINWYRKLCSQPASDSSAWQPEKLDYRFGIQSKKPESGQAPISLVATDYRNGDLDWYTFSVQGGTEAGWTPSEPLPYTPTRISFPGMPLPRWWAFEDSRIAFGLMNVETTDLIRPMLIQFASLYSDDWFNVPVRVPLGSVVKITGFKVFDVFGKDTIVLPGQSPDNDPFKRFMLFEMSRASDPSGPGLAGLLFVLPVLGGYREESSPVEEIHFVRDEIANMVWAVEQTVPNGLGEPVKGLDARQEYERELLKRVLAALSSVENPTTGTDIVDSKMVQDLSLTGKGRVAFSLVMGPLDTNSLQEFKTSVENTVKKVAGVQSVKVSVEFGDNQHPRYRLITTAPANQIPFLPKLDGRSVKLVRGWMPEQEKDGYEAMTRLLRQGDPSEVKKMDEEIVPRAGVKVLLTRQRARWVNGETYVWLGRKVVMGGGEGSGGLRYDVVD